MKNNDTQDKTREIKFGDKEITPEMIRKENVGLRNRIASLRKKSLQIEAEISSLNALLEHNDNTLRNPKYLNKKSKYYESNLALFKIMNKNLGGKLN